MGKFLKSLFWIFQRTPFDPDLVFPYFKSAIGGFRILVQNPNGGLMLNLNRFGSRRFDVGQPFQTKKELFLFVESSGKTLFRIRSLSENITILGDPV